MGKYSALTTDLYSIFASQKWKDENIKAYPAEFVHSGGVVECLRFNAISQSRLEHNRNLNIQSLTGLLIVEIFIPAGLGSSRADAIADILDKHFAGRTIQNSVSGNTQLLSSTLAPRGLDKVNKALQLYQYSLPFNYYGVN